MLMKSPSSMNPSDAERPDDAIGTPVSVKIRERIQAARKRFHANDNISASVSYTHLTLPTNREV